MNSVAIPCLKFNSMNALHASLSAHGYGSSHWAGFSTSPHRLNASTLPYLWRPSPSFLPPRSEHALQANAFTSKPPLPLPIHNALPTLQHDDLPLYQYPHPPSPHHLNTSTQHKPNVKNPSPSTSPSPNVNPPARPGSRHMSHTTHGILTLRASTRLHTRAWLPAGERGDAAE